MKREGTKSGNRLANEKSPYLLQHAMNPVDWYPWGEEALRKAKNDGKPVFLSIGYSTCHWCHVMERESFEDPATAAFINKNFIPVKVDREERPEVDSYYMGAVQAMTGGGGWPLTVFLTPDLKPYYGGTYFPPEPRLGLPSFSQVLEFAVRLWKEQKEEIVVRSDEVAKAIGYMPSEGIAPAAAAIDDGYASLISSFDPENGGFGAAPKFPLPLSLLFLLRYNFRTGKEMALTSVTKTLDAMMRGGIRDHVGGGFHRYSTDRVWLVPHFEKMLYDNALLLWAYAEAFSVTRRTEYADVARETAGWMLSEMRDELGGFYSAQDADSQEGEGTYYTWTPEELVTVLGKEDGDSFGRVMGVTKVGNFDGRSILHLEEEGATRPPAKLKVWKSTLYGARLTRPRPPTDTKILTSWNGLAISALSRTGRTMGAGEYVHAAEDAARFVLKKCTRGDKLLRRYAGGEADLPGTLDDYSFFVQGLLDLFEATFEPRWLEEAARLAALMRMEFEDEEGGGFFLTKGTVPPPQKDGYDGPIPSGNSVAALDLIRLSEMTGKGELLAGAEATLRSFGKDLEERPSSHAFMLVALDLIQNGAREVVVTAPSPRAARDLAGAVSSGYFPDTVTMVATKETYGRLAALSPLLEGRSPGSVAAVYVCRKGVCKLPAKTTGELESRLKEK